MILVLVLFLLTMTLTAGTYLLVNRTLLNRDTAKVRDRLTDSNQQTAAAASSDSAALFLPESKDSEHLLQRGLQKLNLDERLQRLTEQAGLTWAPAKFAWEACCCSLARLTPFGTRRPSVFCLRRAERL